MNLLRDGETTLVNLTCGECEREWNAPLTSTGMRAKPDICPECFNKAVSGADKRLGTLKSEYTDIFKWGHVVLKPEPDKLVIQHLAVVEGTTCAVVHCNDYDHFKRLPEVVSYNGMLLGKSGWNSDTNRCHYQSNANIVKVVR